MHIWTPPVKPAAEIRPFEPVPPRARNDGGVFLLVLVLVLSETQ